MITGGKWVKILDDKGEMDLTQEITRLQFLDFVEDDVQITTNTQEIKGTDGVLTASSTFQPFKLILRFAYTGHDIHDYHLFKTRIRGIIYKRKAYYVMHSDFPSRRYLVVPESIEYEDKYGKNGEVSITFVVVNGYSESIRDTSDITFLTDYWAFEDGVVTDRDIAYEFTDKRFEIWNGSTDVIDPLMRHNLRIEITGVAPNGFTMTNYSNNTVFQYTAPFDGTLILDGVHPTIDGNRVGINTNFDFVQLEPGMNNIEIDGIDMPGNLNVKFKFRFIYR